VFFLKKRTKKLLSVHRGSTLAYLADGPDAIGKSFLLLFSKKKFFLPVPR
jgi:hypothetical protein